MKGTVEKFLFKKISVWIVLLLAILAIIINILFGASVLHYYSDFLNGTKFGNLGNVLMTSNNIPDSKPR